MFERIVMPPVGSIRAEAVILGIAGDSRASMIALPTRSHGPGRAPCVHDGRLESRPITGSLAEEVKRGGDVPVLVKKVGAGAPVAPGRRAP